jgi:prolyl-tRNA synthetase
VKFKDAELIGIPFQIIIGRDSINNEVELLCRTNNTKLKISIDKLLETFISETEIMYNKKS